jgi:hypothetical protein
MVVSAGRMSRLLLFAAAALLSGAVPLSAQSQADLLESVLLPPRFFVGDPVELRLRLQVPAGLRVAAPSARALPAAQPSPGPEFSGPLPVEVTRVDVSDRRPEGRAGEVQVRVFFTSFTPGQGRLPAFACGDLRVPAQEFTTASVREREPEPRFRSLRGQLLLPRTGLRLAVVAVVLLGTPAGLAFAGLWAVRMVLTLAERRRRRRPARRARAALRRVEQGLQKTEAKALFVDLSQILKRYLAERLEVPAISSTTAEIEGLLAPAGVPEPLQRQVREVLSTADRAKFSGMSARRSTAESTMRRIDRIVSAVEDVENGSPLGTSGGDGAHVES